MYQCGNCKSTFERPHKIITGIGKYDICPCCGFDEVEEISICQKCGEPSTLHEMYCEACKNHIRDTMSQSVNFLTEVNGFDRYEVWRIITDLVEREG